MSRVSFAASTALVCAARRLACVSCGCVGGPGGFGCRLVGSLGGVLGVRDGAVAGVLVDSGATEDGRSAEGQGGGADGGLEEAER